jgi:hypothetical protein
LFFAPRRTRLHRISQPVLLTKVETKTLTSNMPSMNWKTFIAARLDNTAGNKNTSVFTEAWSPEQSQDQRFQTLTADPDMVLFAADSNKKLLVLHSFNNAGDTLFRPEKKLICLSGTREIALRECSTATEVAELEAPDENGLVTYPGSASFQTRQSLVF